MSDHSGTNAAALQAQEIEEVIADLQEYRQRIVNDVMEMAKKVKLPQKAVTGHLAQHPELARIDAMLEDLHSRKAALESSSISG